MKKSFLKLACLVFLIVGLFEPQIIVAQAACTITMNGDYTTVNNFYSNDMPRAPVNGDVVCLNAGGPYQYDAQIDITKGATIVTEIRGAGTMPLLGSAGLTQIYVHTGPAIGGYEVPGSTLNPTVANIRFTVDNSSAGGGLAITGNSPAGGISRPWIWHHNDFFFSGPPDCNAKVWLVGTGHGVAYRNKAIGPDVTTVPGCVTGYTNMQLLLVDKSGDLVAEWESASTFGSADTSDTSGMQNFYFEDNYCAGFLGSDASGSARMVWRFNDQHQCNVTTHGFDSNLTGIRAYEYYNNTMGCDVNLGGIIPIGSWFGMIGGTGFMLNNLFPAAALSFCESGPGNMQAPPPSTIVWRKAFSSGVAGWPGAYNDGDATGTYPGGHQIGWGYISGSNITVGADSAQDQPGGAGLQQALEPFYAAANTNNTGSVLMSADFSISPGGFPAMSYSNFVKATAASTVVPNASATHTPYISQGQEVLVIFGDLIGGTAPTITDDCNGGQTWTGVTGATVSGMRASGWTAKFNTTCNTVFTVHHDSSAAARVVVVNVIRGLHATTPIDKNPAVRTYCASGCTTTANGTYDGPATDTGGAPAQTNELVIGYHVLNGPTVCSGNGLGISCTTDTIAAGGSDTISMSCPLNCTSSHNGGGAGTTGSTASTNISVITTYRRVTSITGIQPRIVNSTATPDGISGTITFRSLSNDNDNLDLQIRDLIKPNREFHIDRIPNSDFLSDCTTGTGTGTTAQRPAAGGCTNGVAYWRTDAGGNWDTAHGGANDGCLDKMIAGSWSDCWYTPKTHPHPLATITGTDAGTAVSSGVRLKGVR